MTPIDRTEFGNIVDVLDSQIDDAIREINEANLHGSPEAPFCRTHQPMTAGLIVLLKCQRWTLAQERRRTSVAGVIAAVVAAIVGLAPMVIQWFLSLN